LVPTGRGRRQQRQQQQNGNLLWTALFSRLGADSVLEAHTGWADLANHVVRVHVPVAVPPRPAHLCGTWVDGCVQHHAAGDLIAFDDSKIHRAFNYHPDQDRIVLILDLARSAAGDRHRWSFGGAGWFYCTIRRAKMNCCKHFFVE
jgi:Aspartyl/Asparaginyl beta-hydroxylase